MKRLISCFLIWGLVCLFVGCSSHKEDVPTTETHIDFGDPKPINASELIKDYSFIPLETTDEALLGDVDIVEICKERIYIFSICIEPVRYMCST